MSVRLGRYEITKPIASGGMATVYLARVVGVGGFERLVAVKSMHPHIAADPEFVAMFLDEARLAARLRHPNAVATIDVQENPLFLVMEYVEGPALHMVFREMNKREQRIPLGIAMRIFLDVLDGLHAAHELKGPDGQALQLVHRDISPHNVLIGVDGVTRITDFGVAHAVSRLGSTRGGQVKGKIGYMPPEQLRSEEVDRRSDVYAAGAVLWEMLAGRRLYRADSEAVLLAQVLAGERESPIAVVPEIPQGIADACMKALAADPAQRFPSAAAMAEALESAAVTAGVAIATPRSVGAYVRELAVHDPPDAPSRNAAFTLPNLGGAEAAPPPSLDSTTLAAVPPGASAAPPAVPKRSVVRFVVIAVIAGLAIGQVARVATRSGDDEPAASPASNGPKVVDSSGASAPGRASPGRASPAQPATAWTAAEPVDAPAPSALPTASASASAAAPASAPPAALPGRLPPRPPSDAPPTFRPEDL